ncbi:MAG TPA: tRNA preQ1(34) S-adenosylmethionine ribosyltransferase-isomerase QueA [Myxococcota bacterium]|nr:tRNA preQ1(34) S-adenosylmethionine ribosyltransferase-isomerase QueA [Myxococcales bacterium]HPG26921.1 tRNA preQ1(34) S-adenosylmethionine ribosyltransferase-isomerase QueA [Myxococcota bacterium]
MSARPATRDPLALLDDYDFELPPSSIAQTPSPERDDARLLVVGRPSGARLGGDRDVRVRDLPDWLAPGDLLVVNATRVVPARLVGRKSSGGLAEVLLLGRAKIAASIEASRDATATIEERPGAVHGYRALLKCTGRVRPGLALRLGRKEAVPARVVAVHDRGEVTLAIPDDVDPYAHGEAPLPPYIRRGPRASDAPSPAADPPGADADPDRDLERYQTIYAREPGAIAAPTAGLHLTPRVFERLRERGVDRAEVVLHVGPGTFRPLDAEALERGRLHHEVFELPESTVAAIDATRRRGGRIVAVGTTTTRVLESCVDASGRLVAGRGETDLFLRPGGAPFRVVDALLTNFHLPRSSLLLLVAAFLGRDATLAAYRHAVAAGYRFYSYGDAMLILPADGRATPGDAS